MRLGITMLNRIRNIEPGSDYRKAGKFKGFGDSDKIIGHTQFSISDSKDLSPALEFLSKINWKLINLKFESKKNISLTLKFANYEISTVIDLLELSNLENFVYDISTQSFFDGKSRAYLAKFKSNITHAAGITDLSNADLTSLDTLFERYRSLRFDTELKQSDKLFINNLLTDIQKELEELFDYINKIFLTFISKLTQLPRIDNFDSKDYLEQLVTLISIKVTG